MKENIKERDIEEEKNMDGNSEYDSEDTGTANETEPDSPAPKKKKHTGLVLFLLVLVLAVGGGTAWYFYLRRQPQETVEKYLSAVQKLDFDTMENLLQSNDLSALDDADLRNSAYTDYFKTINAQMTFKIVKNSFNISAETARVTARIRYIDGTEIYKETVSEFLRQLLTKALSGESLTEEDNEQRLATILNEKASSVTPVYTEKEIVYPVIKAGDQWKIVSLDEETVTLMSANFKSVEEEINQTLEASSEDSTDETSTPSESEETDSLIDMTTDNFQIRYTRHQTATDFAGNSCLLIYYEYTNLGTSASSAMVDVSLQAYQNGASLEPAIPDSNDTALDNYMSEIQPGESAEVCQAFSLQDMSDVTLKVSEGLSLGGGESTSQVLKLQ